MRGYSRLKGLLIFITVFSGGWLVRSGAIFTGFSPKRVTQEKPDFGFDDITKQAGITFQHRDPQLDPLVRGKQRMLVMGNGVAIADFNGDGWMDILLVNAARNSKNHLYLNQQGHGFKESAEAWGIANTNQDGATVAPIVFDYDNDGRPDVYLARMGCSMLFHNTGTRFENVSAGSGLGDCQNSMSAVPIDYDGDGKIDLYVIRYWRNFDYFKFPHPTPFVYSDGVVDSRNAGRSSLYRNLGNGRFEDVGNVVGGADTHWNIDGGAADITGDGTQRLYVAADFGPDKMWTARDNKLIDDSARFFEKPDRRWGMNVSFGDLDHDGLPHLFVTNETTAFYSSLHGNFLWKYGSQGKLVDTAFDRGVQHCGGWPWGGAFADFDNDGKQDLYVTDGFITGEPGAGNYEFSAALISTIPGQMLNLTQMGDIKGRSFLGNEVPCVFWNRGSTFDNVSAQTGMTKSWDSRAAGLIDIENNGVMSLVVTTQDGPVHLLKNTVVPSHRWIEIKLVGTKSNRDAAGARVELRQNGQPSQFRWATAGKSGFWASSDPRLHFGLPVEATADAFIRWPSGLVEAHPGLAPGKQYVFSEAQP